VPDKKTGNFLDPKLPGTGLQKGGDAGPGLPCSRIKSQLEPSWENMRKDSGGPILDMMEEDQWPTE
jgi:hypothetical protein